MDIFNDNPSGTQNSYALQEWIRHLQAVNKRQATALEIVKLIQENHHKLCGHTDEMSRIQHEWIRCLEARIAELEVQQDNPLANIVPCLN